MVAGPLVLAGTMATTALASALGPRAAAPKFACGSVTNSSRLDAALTQELLKRQEGEAPDDDSPIELNFIAHLCCDGGGGPGSNSSSGPGGQGGRPPSGEGPSRGGGLIAMIRRQLPGGGNGPESEGPGDPNGPNSPGGSAPGGGGGQGAGGCPSEDTIQKQLEATNTLFAPAKISFKLQKTVRVADGCASVDFDNSKSLDQLQSKTYQGDKATLNVVYIDAPLKATLGVCNVPKAGEPDLGDQDGCIVAKGTLPGMGEDSLIKTTTHELGHAMGLDHPFVTGDPVDGGGGGEGGIQCQDQDGIEDTPPQLRATDGCPSEGIAGDPTGNSRFFDIFRRQTPGDGGGQVTCKEGANANNIMDYAQCTKLSFTQGQIKHMRGVARWRTGKLQSIPVLPGKANGGGNPGGPSSPTGPIEPGGPGGSSSPGGKDEIPSKKTKKPDYPAVIYR